MADDTLGMRAGEVAIELPDGFDAGLYFIGRIRTPWPNRDECPKNARESDAVCTIEVDPRYAAALAGMLAQGWDVFEAACEARPRVQASIAQALAVGPGRPNVNPQAIASSEHLPTLRWGHERERAGTFAPLVAPLAVPLASAMVLVAGAATALLSSAVLPDAWARFWSRLGPVSAGPPVPAGPRPCGVFASSSRCAADGSSPFATQASVRHGGGGGGWQLFVM